MGIGRAIGGIAFAGIGAVGLGVSGIGGEDNTGRDDSGTIVEEGELGAFRIRVGDCLGDMGIGQEIESVNGQPCTGPHMFEVYYAFNLNGDADAAYPGDDSVSEDAFSGCFDRFESFVGHEYETSVYDYTVLTPTSVSWNEFDDREVLCMIMNYDGTEKVGSAAGTGV